MGERNYAMPKQIDISEVATGFRFLLTETFESVQGALPRPRHILLRDARPDQRRRKPPSPWAPAPPSPPTSPIRRYYLEVLEDRMFGRDLSYVNWDQIWDEVGAR